MVSLEQVHASNARLKEFGPGLVALFVGGTSGIGLYTLKAFLANTTAPHIYIVGRSTPAAQKIIEDCKEINEGGKVEFLKADVTELGDVDRVCKEIEKREEKLNLVVLSQGNLNLNGRNESSEGLDRKFTLNYYSRMRFIYNLRPLLRNATTTTPHFARTLSVLGAGTENNVNFDDLELKKTFSTSRCAAHTIVMNDFMTSEFAKRDPAISFLHSFPSIVNTGIFRELPLWARAAKTVFNPLLNLFAVSAEETGARQLFIATSGIYPPGKPSKGSTFASGVPVPQGIEIATGADAKIGSGGYMAAWTGDPTQGKKKLLEGYREKGAGEIFWDHTLTVFERVEKINRERGAASVESS